MAANSAASVEGDERTRDQKCDERSEDSRDNGGSHRRAIEARADITGFGGGVFGRNVVNEQAALTQHKGEQDDQPEFSQSAGSADSHGGMVAAGPVGVNIEMKLKIKACSPKCE